MPCVLPVLSLKLLGLVGHAGERAATRRGFLASSAGIVTAFLILAAVLVAVKQAGGVIGWGIQFQHPWFLVAMTLVLVLFAANLLGWFELPLPAWIGRVGRRRAWQRPRRRSFSPACWRRCWRHPARRPSSAPP